MNVYVIYEKSPALQAEDKGNNFDLWRKYWLLSKTAPSFAIAMHIFLYDSKCKTLSNSISCYEYLSKFICFSCKFCVHELKFGFTEDVCELNECLVACNTH